VLNAANEEAVAAFVAGSLTFTGITDLLERVLDAAGGWHADPVTVDDVLAAENWARARARELVTGGSA
jgi:1-deoxy-D-xylulose-5-phosphate reductoisomerase